MDDLAFLEKLYTDEQIMKHIPGGKRESGAAIKSLTKFIQFYDQNGFGMYLLESKGIQIGYCGLRTF